MTEMSLLASSAESRVLDTESLLISTDSNGSKSRIKQSSVSSKCFKSVFLLRQNTGLTGVPSSSSSLEPLIFKEIGDISITSNSLSPILDQNPRQAEKGLNFECEKTVRISQIYTVHTERKYV